MKGASIVMIRNLIPTAFCAVALFAAPASQAQQATEVQLTYAKGKFEPSEIKAPADKAFTIRVKNLESKAMEFESKSLRVEKVIAAGSEAIVNVRAQKPGSYEFFDEYNEKARGTVVVK